jgi:two-component system sensor histidine kinase TctE
MRNLVDNALNYTPSSDDQPGIVTVRILADRFGHVVVFQVEDNGPGIAESEQDLVFQPFYRALGNEADGSGLGLPIVLEIAQQHHAQVSLEPSHPGRASPGAKFTVRFSALPDA